MAPVLYCSSSLIALYPTTTNWFEGVNGHFLLFFFLFIFFFFPFFFFFSSLDLYVLRKKKEKSPLFRKRFHWGGLCPVKPLWLFDWGLNLYLTHLLPLPYRHQKIYSNNSLSVIGNQCKFYSSPAEFTLDPLFSLYGHFSVLHMLIPPFLPNIPSSLS